MLPVVNAGIAKRDAAVMRTPTETVRYVVGVDGGGTGTRARLTRRSGEVLGAAQAGPSALGQGVAQAWDNVRAVIDAAFAQAKLERWQPGECGVGIGLAGAIVARHRDAFLLAAHGFGRLALASDGFTTLLGAHAGKPGVVVAAGTGSIGEALHPDGTHVSIGGWGFPVGDEGSGAWLGLRAMRHFQHVVDGRAEGGALAYAIGAAAGTTREALLAWCERAGQNAYASLAPLVFDAAASDAVAEALLDRAARALDELALALDSRGQLPLVVSGSIGRRLTPRLARDVRARLVEPAGDAVDGALRLIRGQLNGNH